VESFGSGKISNEELTELVQKNFDLRPGAIIEQFKLREMPSLNGGRFYRDTAAYGHFGRPDLNLPWEDVSDKAAALKQA
jgi:S-adenosylmethionine synthetase